MFSNEEILIITTIFSFSIRSIFRYLQTSVIERTKLKLAKIEMKKEIKLAKYLKGIKSDSQNVVIELGLFVYFILRAVLLTAVV